eukprot:gene14152-15629_t
MAAAHVRRVPKICSHVLAKFRTSKIISSNRQLSAVTQVKIDSGGKVNKSLYDVYLEKKKRELGGKARPKKITYEQPEIDDVLAARIEDEKKKIIKTDLNIKLEKREFTEKSIRAGAIGVKIGMSTLWRKDGKRVLVSLLQLQDCEVMDSRLGFADGGKNHHTEVIIGAVNEGRIDKVSERAYGEYVKYGINPKKKLHGFHVSKDALLPSGTQITAAHFCPGQYLRISGISKDMGFQGVMKRWGMKGQPASHGQTKTHRKMGATGGGGTPGRVFPGKKMAGHMGGNPMMLPGVMLYRINTVYNILYVSGQVPGSVGDFVKIQDTKIHRRKFKVQLPFPTYIEDDVDSPIPEDIYSDDVHTAADGSFSYGGDE